MVKTGLSGLSGWAGDAFLWRVLPHLRSIGATGERFVCGYSRSGWALAWASAADQYGVSHVMAVAAEAVAEGMPMLRLRRRPAAAPSG